MTDLERQALMTAIHLGKSPTVSREHLAMLDSADFKLGWQLAHERIADAVAAIAAGTLRGRDLKVYARQLPGARDDVRGRRSTGGRAR